MTEAECEAAGWHKVRIYQPPGRPFHIDGRYLGTRSTFTLLVAVHYWIFWGTVYVSPEIDAFHITVIMD